MVRPALEQRGLPSQLITRQDVDLPAASAVIAGQAQGVDKTREGGQRELVQQHDANRERGFSRAGASASSS